MLGVAAVGTPPNHEKKLGAPSIRSTFADGWETMNKHSVIHPPNSKPQHQPLDVFAAPNPLELPVQLFLQIFRVALIVLVGILGLPLLKNIFDAGPVEDLQEEKRQPQGG